MYCIYSIASFISLWPCSGFPMESDGIRSIARSPMSGSKTSMENHLLHFHLRGGNNDAASSTFCTWPHTNKVLLSSQPCVVQLNWTETSRLECGLAWMEQQEIWAQVRPVMAMLVTYNHGHFVWQTVVEFQVHPYFNNERTG